MRPRGSKLDPKGIQKGSHSCETAVQERLERKNAETLNFDDPMALFESLQGFDRPRSAPKKHLEGTWRTLGRRLESKLRLEIGWTGLQGLRTAAGQASRGSERRLGAVVGSNLALKLHFKSFGPGHTRWILSHKRRYDDIIYKYTL